MEVLSQSDSLETGAGRSHRSPSISSDVLSVSTKSVGNSTTVPIANPPPAYVAEDEASKLVSGELERAVKLLPSALTMVNEFLDHVLYNIIYTSHSVSLGQLKAAVPSVLKPRLGKAALRVAEEEVQEYIDDEEEADLNVKKSAFQPQVDFDTDLVWKVARLSCMSYSNLGDLEEEDKEEWLEKEQLMEQVSIAQKRFKQSLEVSPGAAIFLAAVIGYLGEQALHYAAQHAQKRHDSAKTPDGANGDNALATTDDDDVILLDGKDMNHVGRDSPLSRLWRSWRRNTRSGLDTHVRPMSPEALHAESPKTGRSTSTGGHPPIPPIAEEFNNGTASARSLSPSRIQLPMSEHDVEEIEGKEVPSGKERNVPIAIPERSKRRPKSLHVMPGQFPSYTSQADIPAPPDHPDGDAFRPVPERKRSSSVPNAVTQYMEPSTAAVVAPSGNDPQVTEPLKTDTLASAAAPTPEDGQEKMSDGSDDETHNDSEAQARDSGLIGGTLAAITGAMAAVGVHHVRQESKNRPTSRPSSRLARNVSNDTNPITSASITGPSDFDNMHVPYGRHTPSELDATQQDQSTPEPVPAVPVLPTQPETQPETPASAPTKANIATGSPAAEVLKADSAANRQRFSGSSYYAATLPVVDENNNTIEPSRDLASSPDRNARRFNSSPRASSAMVPDRGSSIDDPARPRHSATASRSSQYSTHSKSSSSSSRLLGFTRDGQGRPQTIHQQRAAGDMADDVRAAHSTTPTSRHRGGSRPDAPGSPEQKNPHIRIRSDSDRDITNATATPEDAKRSLEVLINSDETLHYTLTPSAATFPQAEAVATSPKRTATQDLADFFRNTAPPGENASKADASIKSGVTGPRSIPASIPIVAAADQRASTATPEKSRIKVGEPRDPQIRAASSTRDLADYVRSTGPTSDDQLPRALSGNLRAASSATVAPSSTSIANETSSVKSSAARKPQSRLKFQARDARPSRNAEASDLIDFIREGPPRAPGEHRIDRHVAPFRTTMDSDDLNALAPRADENGRYRISDTSTTGTPAKSADTSVNSQTALLGKSTANGIGIAASGVPRESPIDEHENGMPKRTRRRVRDPYALDDSDDDLEGDAAEHYRPTEESLIDFLRNTAPATSIATQARLSTPNSTNGSIGLARSPSGSRLRDVLRGTRSPTPPSDHRSNSLKRNSIARAESPHLTQVGSKADTYKPTHATYAAHVDRHRNKSRNEPRESSRDGYGETADLAEYLRSTGPPPGKEFQPQPFIFSSKSATSGSTKAPAKEDAGLKKFFSLKQKVLP